jgi:hypothetical protein
LGAGAGVDASAAIGDVVGRGVGAGVVGVGPGVGAGVGGVGAKVGAGTGAKVGIIGSNAAVSVALVACTLVDGFAHVPSMPLYVPISTVYVTPAALITAALYAWRVD